VVAENSPTLVEAPPSRLQNTGDKKTTSTPEKPAASKPKPATAPETSKPEASIPEASKPGTTQRESSSKSNNAGAMDFVALLSNQMEEFKNMMISTQQQTADMIDQIQTQSEIKFAKIEAELSNLSQPWTNDLVRLRKGWLRRRLASNMTTQRLMERLLKEFKSERIWRKLKQRRLNLGMNGEKSMNSSQSSID